MYAAKAWYLPSEHLERPARRAQSGSDGHMRVGLVYRLAIERETCHEACSACYTGNQTAHSPAVTPDTRAAPITMNEPTVEEGKRRRAVEWTSRTRRNRR